jgi:hypothetical protein
LESFNPLIKDLEITFAPPLAVGNHVDSGRFLHGHGKRDRPVAGEIPFLPGNSACQVLLKDVKEP